MTFWTDSILSIYVWLTDGVSVCVHVHVCGVPKQDFFSRDNFCCSEIATNAFIKFLLWKCDREDSAPDSKVLIISYE